MRKEGLLRSRTISYGCQQGGHVAIAETPEIAACFGNVILVVNLDGLEGLSEFHGGEARVHGDIAAERLSRFLYSEQVVPSLDRHVDPAKTPLGNHPACCFAWRLDGFDMADYREIRGHS